MDDDMANIIVAQLLYLDAVDPTKVRSLFISCSLLHNLLLRSLIVLAYLCLTGYCYVCELSWWISYSW